MNCNCNRCYVLCTTDKILQIFKDPMGNKIGQWKNKVPDNGVFTDSLVMSDHPILGEWKIKAIQGVSLQLFCL